VDGRGEVGPAFGKMGLKEKRSVADICGEHQISQTLYHRWRDKFLGAGKKELVNGAGGE
jgi:transposase-like protein